MTNLLRRTHLASAALAAAMALCLVGAPHTHAADRVTVGDLTITDAWTRQAPPRARAGGGYLTITNTGTQADRLLGGEADFAQRVEIHEMAVVGDVMRMGAVEGGLVIAPGDTVTLKPGGYHVMFMGLAMPPREGETARVTLRFERAGDVTLDLPVAAIGAPGPTGEAPDSHADHHGG